MKRTPTPFNGIDQFFGQFGRGFELTPASERSTGMAVDVADDDSEFVLTADLPGFDREEIELSVDDSMVTIQAEHHHESDSADDDGAYIHRERRTESVQRRVRLPDAVDEDGVSAAYHNGVLTVTLPKESTVAVDDSRRIEIE